MVGTVTAQPQSPALTPSKAGDSSVADKTYHTKVMGKDIGEILSGMEKVDNARIDQKKAAINQIDTQVQQLASLEEKVSALSNAASKLFGKGVGLADGGAFSQLVPVKVSGPDDVILVTADKNAAPIEIEVEVRQLALKDSVNAAQGPADKTTALGWTGSFDISVVGEDAQTINLTAEMTLNDVMHAVNALTDNTNIQANIITYANEARLAFQALNFAEPIVVDKGNLDGHEDLNAANKLPSSSDQSEEDLSAKVRYQGIGQDVLYKTNEIPAGDQYAGIKINLLAANEGSPVKARLVNDETAAGNAIIEFVNAYNDFQEFRTTEDMYKGGAFNTLMGNVGTTLTGLASGLGENDLKTLYDVGLKIVQPRDESGNIIPGKNNILKLDAETLTNALSTKFDQVANVFGFSQTSSNHHFAMIRAPETAASGDINVTFTKSDQNEYSATFEYDNTTYNAVIGNIFEGTIVLEAPENSPLKGLSILYYNLASLPDDEENSRTTTVSMSQGIADKLSKQLQTLLDPKEGSFKKERDTLTKTKLDQEMDLNNFQVKLAAKREREFAKFQRMEIVVAQFEQAQNFIKNFIKTAAAAA